MKNTGNVNAGAFTLADALPAGVTYVANSTKMNGSVIPDSATTVKFPFANAKVANSGNQTVNNGILTTNATTGSGNAGNDSCVITYLVKVAGTNGQVINNTATASVAGLSPTIPLTQSASIAFKIGAGILPVTLIDFYAKEQNGMVELNWATSNEINNSHFEIERSTDGANFSAIGNMQSVNINSLTVQQYSFTDNHLPESANTIYYRLKLVDADGQFTYSNTLLVKATGLKENIFVYPTPAADFINIVFVSVVKSDYNVELINAIGRIVYIGEYKNVQSGQVLELERNGLPPGVYILKVVQHSNESFITRRIIFK